MGAPDDPRLVRREPSAALEPGGWYRAGLAAGATLIDGSVVSTDLTFRFQVECSEGSGDCEPIEVDPPSIDSPLFEEGDAGDDSGGDTADEADAGDDASGDDADVGPSPDVAPDTDTESDAAGDVDASADGAAELEDMPTISGGGRGCAASRGPTPNAALLLVFALPMSVLMGILGGLAWMSADSEIIALRTFGVGPDKLLRPVTHDAFRKLFSCG